MSLMICPDGHRCENGSICTLHPYDEGAYYCDCDEAAIDGVFDGVSCQHQATSYCTYDESVSHVSFCTNGGTCKVKVSSNEAFLGCDCKDGYEGNHCQFIQGTTEQQFANSIVDPPAGYAAAPVNSSGNEGIHPGIIAIIVLIVVAVIGSFGYVVYRKKKSLSTPMVSGKHVQPSSELALDADGGVLKESMNSMSVNGGSRHDDVERSGSGEATVEETADETAPEPLEDIKISDSNDDGTAPEII